MNREVAFRNVLNRTMPNGGVLGRYVDKVRYKPLCKSNEIYYLKQITIDGSKTM